jgi:hypothetical protein
MHECSTFLIFLLVSETHEIWSLLFQVLIHALVAFYSALLADSGHKSVHMYMMLYGQDERIYVVKECLQLR